jgi:aspartyl-tRNA(Asn)/glutamyl-tRNA(Gln) amidotransferase subunit C
MSLKLADVHRIALLARIEITEAQAEASAAQLNDILAMIEQIGRVDTTGVAPMSHPLDGVQRLRPDAVTEHPDRERNLANAPAQQDGLFLVPRVVE